MLLYLAESLFKSPVAYPQRILGGYERIQAGGITGRVPELWDGQAATRIVDVLSRIDNRP